MEKKLVAKIENLEFSYDEENKALDGVSFSIYEGERISIIGHNGSGKSTLAKILIGLLSKFKGKVELFGTELTQKNVNLIRQKIGIVFQNPDNQFVGSTVEDDIAFGLENTQVEREKMQGIIEEYASLVGMKDFLNKEPSNLSGGQKQRVAIAGVLAMAPDLVILDEATSMLDPKGREDISSLIDKIKNEKPNLTIVSITHDLEEASKSDRVIVLNKGRVMFDDKPSTVFEHESELEEVSLNVPFFYALKIELNKQGIKIPENVKNIDELENFLCQLS